MKYRYVFDRVVVVLSVLFGLRNAQIWFAEQFESSHYSSNLLPGGYAIELTLIPIIFAVFYQLYLSQNYDRKFRDGLVVLLVYALVLVGMIKLGLALSGVLLLVISLLLLGYLVQGDMN